VDAIVVGSGPNGLAAAATLEPEAAITSAVHTATTLTRAAIEGLEGLEGDA
jgi:thioredoxin reductase